MGSATLLPASQEFPEGARSIAEFPGSILVPARDDTLLAGLALTGAASWRADSSYAVQFGDSQVVLEGMLGKGERFSVATDQKECTLRTSITYCVSNGAWEGSRIEQFLELAVNGAPAVVTHAVGWPGWPWRVVWHDDSTNTTYMLAVNRCVGDICTGLRKDLDQTGITPNNDVLAQALVSHAATIARLTP